jgi:hypothetical protein
LAHELNQVEAKVDAFSKTKLKRQKENQKPKVDIKTTDLKSANQR